MLLGLQIGGLCDASDQVNLAQQRYPAGDASGDADCTADAAPDDLAFDCNVIVVNEPFFGPWNNGSTYCDGCRKGNLPPHVSHLYVHLVAGDLLYEALHCGNVPARLDLSYHGVFIDQVVADHGDPANFVWLYEGNRSRPDHAARQASGQDGPYSWAKYGTDDVVTVLRDLRQASGDLPIAIAVVEARRIWHGYADADYRTMDHHLLASLAVVPDATFALEMYGVQTADPDGVNDVERLDWAAAQAGVQGRSAPWFAMDARLTGGPHGEAQALRYVLERDLHQSYPSLGFYSWPTSTVTMRANTKALLLTYGAL